MCHVTDKTLWRVLTSRTSQPTHDTPHVTRHGLAGLPPHPPGGLVPKQPSQSIWCLRYCWQHSSHTLQPPNFPVLPWHVQVVPFSCPQLFGGQRAWQLPAHSLWVWVPSGWTTHMPAVMLHAYMNGSWHCEAPPSETWGALHGLQSLLKLLDPAGAE